MPLPGSPDLSCVCRCGQVGQGLSGLPAQPAKVSRAAKYCTPSSLAHPSPAGFLFHTDVSSCSFYQALTWAAVPETRSFPLGSAKMPFLPTYPSHSPSLLTLPAYPLSVHLVSGCVQRTVSWAGSSTKVLPWSSHFSWVLGPENGGRPKQVSKSLIKQP